MAIDNEMVAKYLPYILSALAPVLVGILQQFNKTVSEKAPWYLKSILTLAIGAAITYVSNLVIPGADASIIAGSVLAGAGSVNIALRKGVDREGAGLNA